MKNAMMRRLAAAGRDIVGADVERFFNLGNDIPSDYSQDAVLKKIKPLPSEIPTDDRIDKELTVTAARDLLVSMGLKRGCTSSPKQLLKDIVRPFWDSETDGEAAA